jgi:hypothetical protein
MKIFGKYGKVSEEKVDYGKSLRKDSGGKHVVTKSRFKGPENFFPVVVDDFFNDPEMIVDYGKSLQKEQRKGQPGKRSKSLWEINNLLANAIMLKIMSCYYDLEYTNVYWQTSDMRFQEVPRFSENKNDVRNKGWIHQDDEFTEGMFQLAGLIYLTPDIDPDSGTSLYNAKSNKHHRIYSKDVLYKNGSFDKEEYIKSQIKHEENFEEKLRVQNIFNRLIAYDTSEWHRANSYYNGDGKDARLTLGFFTGNIKPTPLKRIKNSEYESIIKLQIGKNEN